ncbi:MAG: 3-hydroxyacyl-ACP dehydratase [Chitinophagaceae bacterium]
MIVLKENIESLIPQRPPFVMIDELTGSDGSFTSTRLEVRADNIFVQNGVLTEPGLLENIAQTAAARAGYEAKKEKAPVRVGYIGAVKNFEVFHLPAVGEVLETSIILGNQVFDVSVINGTITCGERIIAKCEMKIFIKNHKKI